MKIIIGGAGAVGTYLAQLLSKEKHDITLMDEDENKLHKTDSTFDLISINEAPWSIKALKRAGAADADLFIGVTPEESVNMTCCMIASNLGCRKTVARIDNYEYLEPQNREFFRHLGINTLVYPEMLAAKEITDAVRTCWVRQWWEVGSGDLIMIGVKLRQGCSIMNIPLKNLNSNELPCHIVAIKRDSETIIPRGDDQLLHQDMVYFMVKQKDIPLMKKICGKEDYPEVKDIIIMGGGRIAMRAADLLPSHVHAYIIEKDGERIERLTELLAHRKNISLVQGDGRNFNSIEDINVKNCQAFVAVTGSSEANILGCLTAMKLGIRKTVVQVENTDYLKMAEDLDIGTIINKKNIAASTIYQRLLAADVNNLKTLELANADVAELIVRPKSKVTHKLVKDLGLPRGITIGGMVRDGVGTLVQGNTQLQEGDHVVIFCLSGMIKTLEKYF